MPRRDVTPMALAGRLFALATVADRGRDPFLLAAPVPVKGLLAVSAASVSPTRQADAEDAGGEDAQAAQEAGAAEGGDDGGPGGDA